ncbi:spermidine synthase [Roseovarius sp. MBR-79]|jgi:spermidine synthase
MSAMFEELDYQPTDIGAISLRRRRDLRLGLDVLEIKLGEEFLMTSAFTASEVALARLGLAACKGDALDVVVGGLGLGYTAREVLASDRVARLAVVEYLQPVIDWHESGLVPLGPELTGDPRCRFIRGDFFALTGTPHGYDPAMPAQRHDAILVDIDHSPEGLRDVLRHLRPGGIFGLWSNERPDAEFTARLAGVFAKAWAEEVVFENPLQDRPFTQAVYLARA